MNPLSYLSYRVTPVLGGDPAKRCNANLQNALAMGWDALQVTVRQTGNALTWYEALLRYNSVQSAYVHNYTL